MFCSVQGCERALYAKGFCVAHYFRDRNGDVKADVPVRPKSETRLCEIEGCDKKHYANGYCQMHYKRWKRNGDPNVLLVESGSKFCSVDGCDQPNDARGLCHGHYQRLLRDGDVNRDEALERRKNDGTCIVEGCERPQRTKQLCKSHYSRLSRYGDVRADVPIKSQGRDGHLHHGYREVPVPKDERHLTYGDSPYPEHRLVMARHLGRPVRPDESVHHKNGVKTDNRIENLELWSRWQPSGQRTEDRIADAVELLRHYRPELLAEYWHVIDYFEEPPGDVAM